MVENVGRKLVLIFGVLAVAIGLLVLRERPFRMGLDLRGGTRLEYQLDFEEARRQGQLSENEDTSALLQQTIAILYTRVDPRSVIEPLIRQEGSDRIVIELPGTALQSGAAARGELAEPLDESAVRLSLGQAAIAADFPEGGGVVRIGGERVRSGARSGAELLALQRGYGGSPLASHPAGASVELVSDDAIRNAIENLGELSFQIVANANDFAGTGTDLQAERTRLQEWAQKNPGVDIALFNELPRELGGPHQSLAWYPQRLDPALGLQVPQVERALPLLRPTQADWNFTGQDLASVKATSDENSYPAVGFEFKPARKVPFGDFTRANVNRSMAIVLNGEVNSSPTINGPLPGSGIIQGKFTPQQVNELITVLRSGSLRIKPILQQEERVGPTLGADNIQRNVWAGCVAYVLVAGGMIAYYRLLGLFASIALLVNVLLIAGGLSFMDATLTLPGIGGIILTVGMALDANILIFDRIREELDKGANVKQAAKTGFDKALSAILDSNITTLLAGLILYNVGSGPVRGFAVTLSIGVLTTMFSQLVVTRVLVHYALARGVKALPMGRWLVNANFRFIAHARACLIGSLLVIGAGVTLFAIEPASTKLGIEFLGGASVRFRTEEPQTRDAVQNLVSAIGGDLGRSAEVKPVADSAAGEGRYSDFRVTFKLADGANAASAEGNTFEREIRSALASVLQRGPVELERLAPAEDGAQQVRLKLYFEETHPTEDVAAALGRAGLPSSEVAIVEGQPRQMHALVKPTSQLDDVQLRSVVQDALAKAQDSTGRAFALASPIAESSLVGKQVVGELRDKAILAVLLSLFAIVMYIRVRFSEYSYGIAAVAALAHDVLITLSACAIAVYFGFINAEINVTMIAVFLTIIGYSINDTIVIFDRVRENLPRLKKPLAEVLETSLNQTLSRTILTSTTTFLSVSVMLAFNLGTGNVLESFCYAMLAGMISGVYSTLYVATPILVWLERRAAAKRELASAPATA
jgi:SecD/SecF fusion protein